MVRRNFDSIQVLRGIAATLVVFVHAHLAVAAWNPVVAPHLKRWGFSGVDIFFVLSGLLMVLTTSEKRPGGAAARAFLRARLVRIVPMYWLMTSALVLVLLVAPQVFNKLRLEAGNVIASYLFVPTVNAAAEPYPLVYVGWTLSYEMFFYLVFTALLVFTRARIVPAVAVLFSALVALGQFVHGGVVMQVLTGPLLLEFVLGALIAAAYLRGASLTKGACIGLVLAGLALAAALDPLALHNVLRYGLPAALIVAGCVFLERAGGWPRLRVLKAIGDSSYSLYLTHIFVAPLAARALLRTPLASLPGDVMFVVVVLLCLLVGQGVHLLAERPIERALRKRRQPTDDRGLDIAARI